MVDAMPGCAWGWLRSSRAVASRAAQAGGLGKREAAEPAPCLSHQPGVRRCGINHLARLALRVVLGGALALLLRQVFVLGGSLLGSPFLLLVHPLATQRSVTHHVAGGLLAAAEQLVEPSHAASLPRRFAGTRTRKDRKNNGP